MDMNLGKLGEVVRDGGAWRAAVHGVGKSQARLGSLKNKKPKASWLGAWMRRRHPTPSTQGGCTPGPGSLQPPEPPAASPSSLSGAPPPARNSCLSPRQVPGGRGPVPRALSWAWGVLRSLRGRCPYLVKSRCPGDALRMNAEPPQCWEELEAQKK